MNGTASLLREFDRWDEDLSRLEDEYAAGDWAQRERLMITAQRTVATYRGRILPLLKAEDAPAVTYAHVVTDQLTHAVDLLEDLQRELVKPGQISRLELRIDETLAVIRVLGTVVRRVHELDHANQP
ncbi:hypothetical protein ACGFIF_07335 [Kribbella sp. NPDC049174]|uniref:hypothetical protein n=1 Tax=Kribbella sp. NPDC049174 TaxID=3364112 RepID=UPI0037247743